MKKVAILVNTLQTGGAEKQSIYLLNAIKDDYPTVFIVFHGNLIDEKIFGLISDDNFKLFALNGNYLKRIITCYKILSSNEVDFLFTYLTKPNFLGAIIGKIIGIKNVYGGIRSTKFPIWKLVLEKFIMHFLTTRTIFNSYMGEKLLAQGLNRKSLVIQNCFLEIKDPTPRPFKDHITIISVGRFDDAKDYKTAIKSIEYLKTKSMNFSYQIIGYGKLEKQIKFWIKEAKLENDIQVLINPNNIEELLDKADIYFSTSKFEGTSNSIMEAMNSSLPIVATKVGDNTKLVEQGRNGLLHEVGSHVEMAKSLEILLNDYFLRVRFGMESNSILSKKYSFEKFKNEYIQLIEE